MMMDRPLSSFYHANTTDMAGCHEIAGIVGAVVYGVTVGCALSQNGRQVVFSCAHPNAMARSAAIALVKQLIRDLLNGVSDQDLAMVTVIAVANEKGGVAKTTSCVNLAACLATSGRRVLLIDLDSQANATLNLGQPVAEPSSQPEALLCDPAYPIHEAIIPTVIAGMDLIRAGPSLQNANHALVSAVGRELKLKTKLARYLATPSAKTYDYIMIDSPPAADILAVNALMAATHLIVPVQASYYSISAMGRLSATLDSLFDGLHPCVELLGILLTMYDSSRTAQRVVAELPPREGSAGFWVLRVLYCHRALSVAERE